MSGKKAADEPVSRTAWVVLAVFVTGTGLSVFSQSALTAAMPLMMAEFKVNASAGQWLTTAYMMCTGITLPATGYLMKRFPAKYLFLCGMGVFIVAGFFGAFLDSYLLIIVARCIQALGAGILIPLVQIAVFRLFPVGKRGLAMGIAGVALSLAPALGPAVGGVVADFLGWRFLFIILSILGIIAFLLAVGMIHVTHHVDKTSFDTLALVLAALSCVGLVTGVSNAGEYGIASPFASAPLLVGLCAFAAFLWWESRQASPLLDLTTLHNHGFAVSVVVSVIIFGLLIGGQLLTVLLVQEVQGYRASISGLVMLPGAILITILNPVAGRYLDVHGPLRLLVVGLFALGLGTLLCSFLDAGSPPLLTGTLFLVRMFGIALTAQPLITWGIGRLSQEQCEQGTSLLNSVRQTGGAIVAAGTVSAMMGLSGLFAVSASGILSGIQAMFLFSGLIAIACLIPIVRVMR